MLSYIIKQDLSNHLRKINCKSVYVIRNNNKVLLKRNVHSCSLDRNNSINKSKRVRTRFAPSPTGFVHIGGLRTALFNYLFAKQHNGDFLLRIEDTDQTRLVEGSKENILEMLKWAKIEYDEGPEKEGDVGPYIQSLRTDLYRHYADKLIESGHAYRCFCTQERLEMLKKSYERRGIPPLYDRFCARLPKSEIEGKLKANIPYTVRMKVPKGVTVVNDLVLGSVTFNNNFIDDQILLKSDKFPTYHLANVVDDHLMNISHVIRGEEWMPSTPKHIILYNAFNWEPPTFVHLPLLLNEDRTKLSKRHSHTSAFWYKDKGYIPEAVINFIALLGWNPGNNDYQEIFTMEELIEKFSIDHINKSGSIVITHKLDWLNNKHIKRLTDESPETLFNYLTPFLERKINSSKFNIDTSIFTKEYLYKVIKGLHNSKFSTLEDLCDKIVDFLQPPNYEQSKEYLNSIYKKCTIPILEHIIKLITNIEVIDVESANDILKSTFSTLKEEIEIKKPDLYHSIRYSLTATKEGPEIPFIMESLGKEECINRISQAIEFIKNEFSEL